MKTSWLVYMLTVATTPALADSTIYKCQVNGKTLYSESPCGSSTVKRMDIDTNERMGNETFDRDTIEAARARIRAGMEQPGARGTSTATTTTTTTTRTTPGKKQVCDSVKFDLENIDAQARAPQSGWSQDMLKQQKIDVQKKAIEWAC